MNFLKRNLNTSLLILLVYFLSSNIVNSQIHRAINPNNYHIKYDLDFSLKNFFNINDNNSSKTDSEDNLPEKNHHHSVSVWFSSAIATFFVGMCGVVPVVILPQLADDHHKLVRSSLFKNLISFAAGSLLGDVFIHLLPESYFQAVLESESLKTRNGLWLLFGIFIFLTIEKVFPDDDDDDDKNEEKTNKKLGYFQSIKTIGFLNLFANIIDNFTHGIAVAGSFQASYKFGVMTLLATLLHEIPHEIGDFVILLKSGLSYRQAALAQLITAFSGIFGAMFALGYSSAEKAGNVTSWILPFTSGGFLYISLANIIPELLAETDLRSSVKQIFCMFLGIFIIYLFDMFL